MGGDIDTSVDLIPPTPKQATSDRLRMSTKCRLNVDHTSTDCQLNVGDMSTSYPWTRPLMLSKGMFRRNVGWMSTNIF